MGVPIHQTFQIGLYNVESHLLARSVLVMVGKLEVAVKPDSEFLSLFARTKARPTLTSKFQVSKASASDDL